MTTRRALALSFLDRYAGLVIMTAASMVIARLLTPAEIGVYSVVMVLLGFAATFRDLGAGQYLISRRELTDEALRLTFTLQLSLGVVMAALVTLAATPIASFYGEPRMQYICFVLALNFLATPWLAYPNAVLIRDMRFGMNAIVRSVGAVTYAVVAIGLSLANFGPISLAWANLLTTVSGIVVIHAIADLELPRRPAVRGMRNVLSFGGRLTIVALLDTLRSGVADLTLGRVQGLAAAGYFSRAQGVVGMFEQLVLSAVYQVALPFFSKQLREERDLRQPFLTAVALITGLGWPFFCFLALLAYPIVRLLYGSQWDDAVEPVRWLSLAAALGLPGSMCGAPLIALGALRPILYVATATTVVAVAAAVIGAYNGLVIMTQLLCISSAVSTALILTLACQRLGCRFREVAKELLRSAGIAAASAIVPAIVVLGLGTRPSSTWVALLLAGPGAALGLVASVWLLRHPLWFEIARTFSQGVKAIRSLGG